MLCIIFNNYNPLEPHEPLVEFNVNLEDLEGPAFQRKLHQMLQIYWIWQLMQLKLGKRRLLF